MAKSLFTEDQITVLRNFEFKPYSVSHWQHTPTGHQVTFNARAHRNGTYTFCVGGPGWASDWERFATWGLLLAHIEDCRRKVGYTD